MKLRGVYIRGEAEGDDDGETLLEEDARVLWDRVGACWPPSAVLIVISGDVATMISRRDASFVSTCRFAGTSDGSSTDPASLPLVLLLIVGNPLPSREEGTFGVGSNCKIFHIKGTLR